MTHEGDRDRARRYVQMLFEAVLDRTSVSPAELDYWTERLMTQEDAVTVFERFVKSKENQTRRQNLLLSRTQYPHGHFYSPVVSRGDLEQQREQILAPREHLGINLDPGLIRSTLARISKHFASMPFSDEPDGRRRYYYNNTSYGFGDACFYWGMLGDLRPERIIEVGSGFTSALALDAIDVFGLQTHCTFIDPYPQLAAKVTAPLNPPHDILGLPVQQIDPSLVEELGRNDILFIDSSHVVKTGSDVHFEITELLPRLRPGVIVHFHDIFYPFEYPADWIFKDNKSWNELYFLQAFLMFNNAFEIVFFNSFLAKAFPEDLKSLGDIGSRIRLNPGGGLWLRRKDTPLPG